MKKYIPIIFAAAVLLIGGGYYFMNKPAASDDVVTPENQEWAEYKNETAGFSFEYRTSPDGYVVIDQLAGTEAENPDIAAAITLMLSADQAELLSATVPREAPPTLNVAVIKNPNKYSLQEWIEVESGFGDLGFLLDSAQKVNVDGREGIRFTSDGLYTLQNIVVADEDRIFVLIGAYIDTESHIYRDFEQMLLATFKIL